MILKTPDGHYVELNDKEYTEFVVEIMLHFHKENKLDLRFEKDTRYEAAQLMLNTVATQGKIMDEETKQGYIKVARELLESYNNDPKTHKTKMEE